MSISNIESRLFNSTASVQRRVTALTSTGDLSETWNNLAINVPITIQSVSVSEMDTLNQGKEYKIIAKAYMATDIVTVKNGDRIIDNETNKTYEIVGEEIHQAARNDIGANHHRKLYLQIPRGEKT